MSFRAHDDSFLGVVIGRGTSPGKAASRAIDRLELASSRASIVAIPVEKEKDVSSLYLDKLLTEEESLFLIKLLDTTAVSG